MPWFGTVWNTEYVTNVTAIKKKKSDFSDTLKKQKSDNSDAIKKTGNADYADAIKKAVSVGRNQSTPGHKQRKCNKCNTDKKDQRPRVKVSTIYSLSATSTGTE